MSLKEKISVMFLTPTQNCGWSLRFALLYTVTHSVTSQADRYILVYSSYRKVRHFHVPQ